MYVSRAACLEYNNVFYSGSPEYGTVARAGNLEYRTVPRAARADTFRCVHWTQCFKK